MSRSSHERLVAIARQRYGGQWLKPGDLFPKDIPRQEGDDLVAMQFAKWKSFPGSGNPEDSLPVADSASQVEVQQIIETPEGPVDVSGDSSGFTTTHVGSPGSSPSNRRSRRSNNQDQK